MIEWFKAHPLAAGLIVFGVGLIFVLALFGGSSNSGESTVVTADNSDVGANSALVAAQLNAGVQIQTAQIQANVQMAAIDAAKSTANTQTAAQVTAITTAADTSKYISTLQATNDAAQIQAAKDINAANLGAAQSIATIQAGADTTIANIYAQVSANNNDVTKYGIDAQKAVALDTNQKGFDLSLSQQQLGYMQNLQRMRYQYDYAQNVANIQSANFWATGGGQLQVTPIAIG